MRSVPSAEYYQHFMELMTYIGRRELGMGVAMLFTMPGVFKDRDIIHFVDNAPALSNLVNGYAGKPDMARLVCMRNNARRIDTFVASPFAAPVDSTTRDVTCSVYDVCNDVVCNACVCQ